MPTAARSRPFLASLALTLAACQAPEPQKEAAPAATTSAEAPQATAAETSSGEVEFDPSNPPPPWVKCHRNHCHSQDGRVASYAQVMQEIGATKIVGGPAPKAAPAAPPDVAAIPADAEKTASGLASRVLRKGEGSRRPGPDSVVSVHYTGWTTDGRSFDSSIQRGRPAQFPLNRVIKGWTEGLQLMVEGEERRFWIPAELAYEGKPGKPQGMLVFDVELLSIKE